MTGRNALRVVILTVWFVGVTASISAQLDAPHALTQKRINEFAAALDSPMQTMVVDTGLRRPQERLPDYLKRIARRLPEETPPQHRARIENYLTALDEAARQTAPLRRLPALRDTTPQNRALWQRIAQTLALLPRRMEKLRIVWKRESSAASSQAASTTGTELHQTLQLVLSARDGLRDARP